MSYFSKILIYLLLFSVKAIGAELRSGTNLQTLPEPQEGRIDTNGKFVPPGNELPSGASSGQPQRKDDTLFHPNRVQDLGGGRLAIGEVVANATTREISFPAQVNMRTGPLEYALVHANGKIHESLFKTAVRPEDIHLAALLLGMKPQQASVELDLELVIPSQGAIQMEVGWKKHGPNARYPLEALILKKPTSPDFQGKGKSKLAEGSWHYNGSSFHRGRFLASQEGSIIALIPDQSALINNPRPGRMNDEGYSPNTELLPELEKNVTITFHLPKPEKSTP